MNIWREVAVKGVSALGVKVALRDADAKERTNMTTNRKQIPNDPSRAGQQEGRRIASRFGNRYAVAQIHTRFAGYQWFVLDAEQFDTDLDCYGVVVGQFDDRQAALDRSDQLNREAAMADEFDDLCEPTVDDSTSECYWCGRIVHGSGEDCGGCSERREGDAS